MGFILDGAKSQTCVLLKGGYVDKDVMRAICVLEDSRFDDSWEVWTKSQTIKRDVIMCHGLCF